MKPDVYIKKIPIWYGSNPSSKIQSRYAAKFRDKIARNLYGIDDLQIQYGNKGKPFFINSRLCFNVSHSCRMVCVVFYDKPVGIDIEYIRPRKMMDQLASRYFHKDELCKFKSLDNRIEYFYRIWTRKESYLKFLGIGVGGNLKKYSTEGKPKNDGKDVIIVSYVKGSYYISYTYQD
ncbi:MAG: 4'-phosphopantetheinyl transferase superfamily protein [Spirochaetes bacterium]|nr:4'-phosphopantetheinyl transferase superfamily protein [Spirochaetota bacterium]MBN2770960.1 4'-phosphopantetheinyl transferase superfamily protein [Spirochaetota bacterium]